VTIIYVFEVVYEVVYGYFVMNWLMGIVMNEWNEWDLVNLCLCFGDDWMKWMDNRNYVVNNMCTKD
jgi:hypothetical protein